MVGGRLPGVVGLTTTMRTIRIHRVDSEPVERFRSRIVVELLTARSVAPPSPPPALAAPAMAKRRGEQGRVLLRVLVSADGDALTVEVLASSGSETLDRTAVEAVRPWRFVPARLGTTPVEAW